MTPFWSALRAPKAESDARDAYSQTVRAYHGGATAAAAGAAPAPQPAVVTPLMRHPPAELRPTEQDRLWAVAVRNRDEVAAQRGPALPTERLCFARFLYMRGRINEFCAGPDPVHGGRDGGR